MAEEIISSWDSVQDLMVELVTDSWKGRRTRGVITGEDDGPPKSFYDYAAEPDLPGDQFAPSWDLRLIDADGNTVRFPLKLISNTTFTDLDELDAMEGEVQP